MQWMIVAPMMCQMTMHLGKELLSQLENLSVPFWFAVYVQPHSLYVYLTSDIPSKIATAQVSLFPLLAF